MAIPTAAHSGLTFFPVPQFDEPAIAFGADASAFLPNRYALPNVPSEHKNAAMRLFYQGGSLPELDPRVDRDAATRAVKAWLASWAPSHEQKEATVGYAFWVWTTPEAIDAAIAKAAA